MEILKLIIDFIKCLFGKCKENKKECGNIVEIYNGSTYIYLKYKEKE